MKNINVMRKGADVRVKKTWYFIAGILLALGAVWLAPFLAIKQLVLYISQFY